MKSLIGHVLFNGIKRSMRSSRKFDVEKMMDNLEADLADIVVEADEGFRVAFAGAMEKQA